jgi:hypothetical protein
MFARLFSILFEGTCFKLNAKTFGVLNLKRNTSQPLVIKGRLVSVLYTCFKFRITVSVQLSVLGIGIFVSVVIGVLGGK